MTNGVFASSGRRLTWKKTCRLVRVTLNWSIITKKPTMEQLPNIHPGEILQKDFLDEFGLTAYRLAKDIGVSRIRISEILHGKRDITPDTAIRLGLYFGIEPEFWLNLQAHYNLVEARMANPENYQVIPQRAA